MKKYIILYLFILIFSVQFAEEDDRNNYKRYELDEMRVIATTPSEATGVISIVPIEGTQKSELLNLSEIMRDISGVNISVGGRGESNLTIRGFRSENIKIMVDGRQVNSGYFGNINLAEIPMFDISEIQIIKGAISPIYGTNSSGGVVNFITKKPDNKSWLTLKGSIKRNNTQNLQIISAHSFDIWDYWVNFSGFKTDGFVLSNNFTPTVNENGGVRDFSNNSNFNIQSKFNFSLFNIHSIGISGGYSFADERNVPHNIYEARYRQFKDLRRWHVTGLGAFQVTPYLNIQPNVFYDSYDNTYQEFSHPSLDEQYLGLDSILNSWTFGTQIRADYILSANNRLNFMYKIEKDAYNRKDNQSYLDWTTNFTYLHNSSLLFIHKINTLWQSSTALGVSQSHRLYKENSWDSERKSINTKWQLEPAIAINYDDFVNNLNLALSRNIQYPYLQQLYSYSRGNLELEPEKIIKTEVAAGRRFIFDRFAFSPDLCLYYNVINDMIDRAGSARFMNQRRLMNAGFEFELKTNFLFKNNYLKSIETAQSLDYINLNMNENYTFAEIPEWSLNNMIAFNLLKNIKLSYSVNWKDEMFSPNDNGTLHLLEQRTIHNASLNYNIRNYAFGLSIINIFDKDYQEEYGYPAPGRDFSISFEWKL